jgi:hypothetical protein
MQATQATLLRLRTTLDRLDPLVTNLMPGARELAPAEMAARRALVAASPLLRAARPTVLSLRPAIAFLAQAAASGNKVISSLEPTLARTRTSFIPYLQQTNPDTKLKNYEAIGPTISSGSSAFSWGDLYGPMANFEPGAGGQGIVGGATPCTTAVLGPNPTPQTALQCQSFVTALETLVTGVLPSNVRFSNSRFPQWAAIDVFRGKPVRQVLAQLGLAGGR